MQENSEINNFEEIARSVLLFGPTITALSVNRYLCSVVIGYWMMPFHIQRDNAKKRLESHHFDSNGTSGKLLFHHLAFLELVKKL